MAHKWGDRRAGQVAVILAVSMVALMAFVALGIDAGRAFADARAVQNAADGAALAGAEDVARSTHDVNYNPAKARMDAIVYLARNLSIMSALNGLTCNGTSLTPNYSTIPSSYSQNIDAFDCYGTGSVDDPIQVGSYGISIYQPPQHGFHASPPDYFAIEVNLTDGMPTTFAAVIGVKSISISQRAVAGSTNPRGTLIALRHYSVAPSDISLNAATLDVVNGDIYDNSGLSSGIYTPSTIDWWYCNPRQYGGGDPATDGSCALTSDEHLYKWNQASASVTQSPNNTVQNLVVYIQDPNYAFPAWYGNGTPTLTTPDCKFQPGGAEASYYSNGVVNVPVLAAGQTFHIAPGAYKQIIVPSGFAGTVILDPTPTIPDQCPSGQLGDNGNSDKTQPYGFLLGSPGQTQRAIDMSLGGTLVGNGVFLLVQAPGSTSSSNQIAALSGAKFYLNGRSDIFGYSGAGCITAPVNQTPTCAMALPSPWGTLGSLNGVYQGDPISVMVAYVQGASASNPGTGSHVVDMSSGTSSDIQGVIYAPDDNVTIAGGAVGSGVGRVVAYTISISGNNSRVIEEYASTASPVFGLFN